jgi:hypothetical protein
MSHMGRATPADQVHTKQRRPSDPSIKKRSDAPVRQKRQTVESCGQTVDIRIVKVQELDFQTPRSIAEGQGRNNGSGAVIHRRANRQSCVFHTVHRLLYVLHPPRIGPSSCGFARRERMFAPGRLWIS